jgi:hypothetical protein
MLKRDDMVNPLYFKGVGVGLVIAWVTGVLAYWLQRKGIKHTKIPIPIALILLELVLSVAFLAISYLI